MIIWLAVFAKEGIITCNVLESINETDADILLKKTWVVEEKPVPAICILVPIGPEVGKNEIIEWATDSAEVVLISILESFEYTKLETATNRAKINFFIVIYLFVTSYEKQLQI